MPPEQKIGVSEILNTAQHEAMIRESPVDQDFDSDEEVIKAEMKKQDNQQEVFLTEDIYCIAFLTFIKGGTSRQLDRLVLKCVFTFALQIMIVGLMLMQYLNVDASGDSFTMGGFFNGISAGTPSVNLTRIVCCFLLHVTILPEMTVAGEMLRFGKKNPTAFQGQRFDYGMMFALFKLFGGLLCFLINIVIMLRSESIEDVIKDFVAVEVISTIDDMMAATCDEELDRRLYQTRDKASLDDGTLIQDYVMDAWTNLLERNSAHVKEYFYLRWKTPKKAEKFRQILEAIEDGHYEERFSN